MAAREQRRQCALDDTGLAHDHHLDLLAHALEVGTEGVDRGLGGGGIGHVGVRGPAGAAHGSPDADRQRAAAALVGNPRRGESGAGRSSPA